MALNGSRFKRTEGGPCIDHPRRDVQLAASQTMAEGDCFVVSNGELTAASSSTTQVDVIGQEAAVSSTGDIVKPAVLPARAGIFEFSVTPLHDKVSAVSGTTTTAVIAQAGYGSGNELRYGTMLNETTGEQRRISASSATGGGNITLTTEEAFSRAVATGDKISTLPFGIEGDPKLATKSTISNAQADLSGGPVRVKKIDMKNRKIEVKFK